ncbi:MAG: hypothetical protein OHK005_04500 [Candidatus Methylacidiphilales bacterium]
MKIIGPLAVMIALAAVVWIGLNAMQQNPDVHSDTNGPAAYRQAMTEAKETGKPVMVMFTAEWCGPCRQMKKNVLPSAVVQSERSKWIWVVLDVDQPENQALARQYGVRGIPAFFFLDSQGRQLHKITGGRPPDQFAALLRKYASN